MTLKESKFMAFRLGLFLICLSASASLRAQVEVLSSIPPIHGLVEELWGAPKEKRALIVAPGASPVFYDPGPKALAGYKTAKVFFAVGVPYERTWRKKLQELSSELKIVDLSQHVALRDHGHSHHHHDDNGGKSFHHDSMHDPHFWMSPKRLKKVATVIYQELKGLYPEASSDLTERHVKIQARLDALDASVKNRLGPFAGRSFFIYHPSLGYLAQDYGLEQLALELQGKGPGAKRLAQLTQMARQKKASVVFVQSEFEKRFAQILAKEIGARLVEVNPLAEDIFMSIDQAARALEESWKGSP